LRASDLATEGARYRAKIEGASAPGRPSVRQPIAGEMKRHAAAATGVSKIVMPNFLGRPGVRGLRFDGSCGSFEIAPPAKVSNFAKPARSMSRGLRRF
jgi:hypothetical protein